MEHNRCDGLGPAVAFTTFSRRVAYRVIETEIGAALCAMFGAGRT